MVPGLVRFRCDQSDKDPYDSSATILRLRRRLKTALEPQRQYHNMLYAL
jgi:hypothetical protein